MAIINDTSELEQQYPLDMTGASNTFHPDALHAAAQQARVQQINAAGSGQPYNPNVLGGMNPAGVAAVAKAPKTESFADFTARMSSLVKAQMADPSKAGVVAPIAPDVVPPQMRPAAHQVMYNPLHDPAFKQSLNPQQPAEQAMPQPTMQVNNGIIAGEQQPVNISQNGYMGPNFDPSRAGD